MKFLNDINTAEKLSNIAAIVKEDTANGEGIRTSIFFSGCTFNCPECQNQKLHDFNYGNKLDKSILNDIIYSLDNVYIDGISILGGEPLHEKNKESVLYLIKEIKNKYPEKTVWLWTGYTLEELIKLKDSIINEILINLDTLIDGRYIKDLHVYNLLWRGSSNQNIYNKKEIEEK